MTIKFSVTLHSSGSGIRLCTTLKLTADSLRVNSLEFSFFCEIHQDRICGCCCGPIFWFSSTIPFNISLAWQRGHTLFVVDRQVSNMSTCWLSLLFQLRHGMPTGKPQAIQEGGNNGGLTNSLGRCSDSSVQSSVFARLNAEHPHQERLLGQGHEVALHSRLHRRKA